MNEVTMNVLEIDGKDFILIETIDKYNFFVEENDPENICILKDEEEDFVTLDSDEEFDEALKLYYEKLKK